MVKYAEAVDGAEGLLQCCWPVICFLFC